jgi:tripartite-type tricarboxylate transporter receptor subunit TctC
LAPLLYAEPGYELKDFTAIGGMNQGALLMVGSPNQPAKNLTEFVALAKQKPGELTFASGGVGTTTYLAASMFMHQAGIKLLHVPYKGTGGAMPDVLSGRVNIVFDAENQAGPHIRDGKLRAFGASSPTRSKGLPDVPTIAEQGFPNYSFTIYNGLLVRAGTPRETVQRLSEALQAALTHETVRERIRKDGTEPWPLSAEELNAHMRRDAERVAKLAADMGMQKQ